MGKVYTFRDIMKALCSQSEYHIFTREILDKHSQPNRLDEHSKQKKNNRLSCFDAEASNYQQVSEKNTYYTLRKGFLSNYINGKTELPGYWNGEEEDQRPEIPAKCVSWYIISALEEMCFEEQKYNTEEQKYNTHRYDFLDSFCRFLNMFYLENDSVTHKDTEKYKQITAEIQTFKESAPKEPHKTRDTIFVSSGHLTDFSKNLYEILYPIFLAAITYETSPKGDIQPEVKAPAAEDPLSQSRRRLVEKIANDLIKHKGRKAIFLYGSNGVGKSFTAKQIFERLKRKYSVIYLYYNLSIRETLESHQLTPASYPDVLILDDVDNIHDNMDMIHQLLTHDTAVLLISNTNCIAVNENAYFEAIQLSHFSGTELCRYAAYIFEKENAGSIIHTSDDENILLQIAQEVQYNTDIFVQIVQNISQQELLLPCEILALLKERTVDRLGIGTTTLAQQYFRLYFSSRIPFTHEELLFISFMAFLPSISREMFESLFEQTDCKIYTLQKLLGIGIVKKTHAVAWLDENARPYFYFNADFCRAVEYALPVLMQKIPDFAEQLQIFLKNISSQIHSARNAFDGNGTNDRECYNTFLRWTKIGNQILWRPSAILEKFFEIDCAGVTTLLLEAFDANYFACAYENAKNILERAAMLYGKNLPEQFEDRGQKLRLVTSWSPEIYSRLKTNPSPDTQKINVWETLENRELWKSDLKKVQSAVRQLSFASAEVLEVKKTAADLLRAADTLAENKQYVLDIIDRDEAVELHIVTNPSLYMRRIDPAKDAEQLRILFRSTFFMPKKSWKTTPIQIAEQELENDYCGWGIFTEEDNKLISFIDKKMLTAPVTGLHAVQISFLATHIEYRSKALARCLLNFITLKYPNEHHFFTTHDQNGSMVRAAKTAGYEELSGIEQITGKLSAYRNIPEENFEEICIKNRIIDSISTIYWWKKALVLL